MFLFYSTRTRWRRYTGGSTEGDGVGTKCNLRVRLEGAEMGTADPDSEGGEGAMDGDGEVDVDDIVDGG